MKANIESRHLAIDEIVNSIRILQGVGKNLNSDFIQKHGITGPQLGTLRFISMKPNISMRELSEDIYLHISTVSGIVDRLVKRGYVTRQRSTDDRRIVHIRITPSGKKIIKNTPLSGMGLLIHKIDTLTDKQLHDIQRGLRLIFDIMKIGNEKI